MDFKDSLRAYLDKHGMTLRMAEKEMKEAVPSITMPLISYVLNGVVEPPSEMMEWLARKQIEEANEPLSYMEEIVLSALKGYATKDAPLRREDLRFITGMDDRKSRNAIESLRRRGVWIVNGPEGNGYYITNNREELEKWLATYTARSRQINKTAAVMRASDPRQTRMEDKN